MLMDRDQGPHAKLSLTDFDTGFVTFLVLTSCAAELGQFCSLREYVKSEVQADGEKWGTERREHSKSKARPS